jgi:hypothetical protein
VESDPALEELLGPLQNLDCGSASQLDSGSPPDSECDLPKNSDLEDSEQESNDSECSYGADCELPTDLNPLGARFFGKAENLQILREVNQQFQLPSWIGRVPPTVGAAKGGKLKADEWVILFQLCMIPTVIRILFKNDFHDFFDIRSFENVLHLASIVNIIRSLQIGNNDIEKLQHHLQAYLQGIRDIYPSFPTKPNHHMALHSPDCLRQCGPAPQWTAWSFERLNGSLASIPTNNHIGKPIMQLIHIMSA